MPIVRFPVVMRYYVDNQNEFFVPGATILELLQNLLARYPLLQPHLVDKKGELRRHFHIFVNGVHIRELSGMDTPLQADDKVIVMASAAGGSESGIQPRASGPAEKPVGTQ